MFIAKILNTASNIKNTKKYKRNWAANSSISIQNWRVSTMAENSENIKHRPVNF
jgi:hypothetical protein